MHPQNLVDDIEEMVSIFPLRTQIEIIANLLIRMGTRRIPGPEPVTPLNVLQIVMDDLDQNGETLPNALARQGLIMNSWPENIE